MIKQIIIRNDSSKGYRITHNNFGFEENQLSDDLMLSLVPRSANKKKLDYFYPLCFIFPPYQIRYDSVKMCILRQKKYTI